MQIHVCLIGQPSCLEQPLRNLCFWYVLGLKTSVLRPLHSRHSQVCQRIDRAFFVLEVAMVQWVAGRVGVQMGCGLEQHEWELLGYCLVGSLLS
jgi:hypothetical protein